MLIFVAVGNIPTSSESLTIGESFGPKWKLNRPFIGAIDEVKIYNKIYNKALKVDEIIKAMEFASSIVQPSEKLIDSWGRIKCDLAQSD